MNSTYLSKFLSKFVSTWASSWLKSLLCFLAVCSIGMYITLFVFKAPFEWDSFLVAALVPLACIVLAHILKRRMACSDQANTNTAKE